MDDHFFRYKTDQLFIRTNNRCTTLCRASVVVTFRRAALTVSRIVDVVRKTDMVLTDVLT